MGGRLAGFASLLRASCQRVLVLDTAHCPRQQDEVWCVSLVAHHRVEQRQAIQTDCTMRDDRRNSRNREGRASSRLI